MSQSYPRRRLRKQNKVAGQSSLGANITSLYSTHPTPFFSLISFFRQLPPVNFPPSLCAFPTLSPTFLPLLLLLLLLHQHHSFTLSTTAENNNDDNCLKQPCTFTPSSARRLHHHHQSSILHLPKFINTRIQTLFSRIQKSTPLR